MKRKASYSHHFTDGWDMGKWRGKEENDQRLGIWDKQSLGITREHELAVEGPHVME